MSCGSADAQVLCRCVLSVRLISSVINGEETWARVDLVAAEKVDPAGAKVDLVGAAQKGRVVVVEKARAMRADGPAAPWENAPAAVVVTHLPNRQER